MCGRILIVEDDDFIRQDLSDILGLKGYRVAVACNGKEALDELREGEPPCLILLDLMMPVMNGWEFREAQRGSDALARIPVVLLSGHGRVADEAEALGADGFLLKPFELDDLLRTVARYCGET